MELIIQKAVELGVYEIIPVATKRAVVKLDDKKASKKVERWNAISEGGAKQSGRNVVPEVKPVMSYKEEFSRDSLLVFLSDRKAALRRRKWSMRWSMVQKQLLSANASFEQRQRD